MTAGNTVRVRRETKFQLTSALWNRWRVEYQNPETGEWLLMGFYPSHGWAMREADRAARIAARAWFRTHHTVPQAYVAGVAS